MTRDQSPSERVLLVLFGAALDEQKVAVLAMLALMQLKGIYNILSILSIGINLSLLNCYLCIEKIVMKLLSLFLALLSMFLGAS